MWIYKNALCAIIYISTVHSYSGGLQKYAPAHDDYKPTDYSFSYGVRDYHTGDIKDQWEKKDGGRVTGHYSLVEPDGSIRTVEYSADNHNGFNAVVRHTGSFKHPISHIESKDEPSSHNELILQHKFEKPIYEEPKYEKLYYGLENKDENYKVQYKYTLPEQDEELKYISDDSSYQPEDIAKPNYVYPNKEESAEESQHSEVKSKHHYGQQTSNLMGSQVTIKEEYKNLKYQEASKLNHKNNYSSKDTSLKPSHEITEEELRTFLQDYHEHNSNIPMDSYLEGGFKPIKNKPKNSIRQPNIPGTFISNKKPKTTLGLSSYTSKRNSQRIPDQRHPKVFSNYHQKSVVPQYHYYLPIEQKVEDIQLETETTKLYHSLPNNGYNKYLKNSNYKV